MPPRIKAKIKRELLTWSRTTAGFITVEEAAAALKLDPARLANWESGEDAPTIPQLRKLSRAYRRPLAVFFLQEEPEGFQVLRDLRRLPGMGMRRLSPAMAIEIRRAQQQREFALELFAELGEAPPKFDLSIDISANPETAGQQIRAVLGVSDEGQARWRDGDGRAAFNGWREKIEAQSVLVFQATQIESDEASGIAIAGDQLPVIVVNRKDSLTRRTFSLLHELAHLMLRVSGISDLETEVNRPPEDQAIEVFCNRVAAAALIPRDTILGDNIVLKYSPGSEEWSDDDIIALARNFGVSREAILRRLLQFGKTTERFYERKRAELHEEFLAQRQLQRERNAAQKIPRNMPQETMSNLGRPLVAMVLDNYHQDRLTLSDVAGVFGVKTKHIPKIEQTLRTRTAR